jgi:hypothetical protein
MNGSMIADSWLALLNIQAAQQLDTIIGMLGGK